MRPVMPQGRVSCLKENCTEAKSRHKLQAKKRPSMNRHDTSRTSHLEVGTVMVSEAVTVACMDIKPTMKAVWMQSILHNVSCNA